MRSNRKLTQEEKENLKRIKPLIRYTHGDLVFMTNIYNEFVDNWALCLSCANKISELKNGLYNWYSVYKDNEVKEAQLLEQAKIVEENKAKLAKIAEESKQKEKEEKMKSTEKNVEKENQKQSKKEK